MSFSMERLVVIALLIQFCTFNLVASDWIDPDTPEEAKTTQPLTVTPYFVRKTAPKEDSDSKKEKNETKAPTTAAPTFAPTIKPTPFPTYSSHKYELVFSEEFNTPDRTFEDGTDPRWTSLEKNDYTNDALHYYSTSNARTKDGSLVIKTEASDTDVVGFDDVKRKNTHVTKHFKSAMLQTWNKFCFTGGIIEAEVELPGKHNVGGLWPAFWLLGNLARHTYVGSSEHIWPWSSGVCTTKSFSAQHISACREVGHYGMLPHVGRGSPEMDIFEVQPGDIKANNGPFLRSSVGQPFMSASFQVAPGLSNFRPGPGYWPGPGQWYTGLVGGKNTSLNVGFYGNYNHFRGDPHPEKSDYWSDAISYNRQLDASHFNGSHTYRLEWDVPTAEKDGYLHWFLDGELVLAINGTGVATAGEGSEISSEPSYIILNTAVSKQWGFPIQCPAGCECKEFDCHSSNYSAQCGFSPGFCKMMLEGDPEYKINSIRVYQNPDFEEQKVGCSTPERPTRRYIEGHADLYKEDKDERPLKSIQQGRGNCRPGVTNNARDICGGAEHGTCTRGKVCECKKGWTGPHCLASAGYNTIEWDVPDSIADLGFIPPSMFPRALLIGLLLIIVAFFLAMQLRSRLGGWTPIPEVDTKPRSWRGPS
ncbi:unnamed protein product [Cylindrotheca closterium]|uniref:GH16 domain-containing protein n=1 Tax=Cylindrotheca closterium TaxID=2856 RepID=A0AAD2JHB1_9STRA|nr:unnamed protein product [Cylindrotheca closterium]